MYKNRGRLIRLPEAHSWMNQWSTTGPRSFVHDSTESSDFKSARCQDGIFGQLKILAFQDKKLETNQNLEYCN